MSTLLRPDVTPGGVPSRVPPSIPGLCANLHGFTLHAAVGYVADQHKALKQVSCAAVSHLRC